MSKVEPCRGHGLDPNSDNGGEWGGCAAFFSDPRSIPLRHRMQEPREIQDALYDYEPGGGSCYREGLATYGLLEDE